MSDERKLPTKEELTEWRIKYGRYLDSRFSRMIGKLLFAAEERERLQAAIMRRGRGCAVGITGDPEDAEGLGLNEALLAIDECIRFGREAHNERVRLQAEVERYRGLLHPTFGEPFAILCARLTAERDGALARLAKIEELARVAEHYSSQVKPLLDFILHPTGDTP